MRCAHVPHFLASRGISTTTPRILVIGIILATEGITVQTLLWIHEAGLKSGICEPRIPPAMVSTVARCAMVAKRCTAIRCAGRTHCQRTCSGPGRRLARRRTRWRSCYGCQLVPQEARRRPPLPCCARGGGAVAAGRTAEAGPAQWLPAALRGHRLSLRHGCWRGIVAYGDGPGLTRIDPGIQERRRSFGT
jgi:hypothetical protein